MQQIIFGLTYAYNGELEHFNFSFGLENLQVEVADQQLGSQTFIQTISHNETLTPLCLNLLKQPLQANKKSDIFCDPDHNPINHRIWETDGRQSPTNTKVVMGFADFASLEVSVFSLGQKHYGKLIASVYS